MSNERISVKERIRLQTIQIIKDELKRPDLTGEEIEGLNEQLEELEPRPDWQKVKDWMGTLNEATWPTFKKEMIKLLGGKGSKGIKESSGGVKRTPSKPSLADLSNAAQIKSEWEAFKTTTTDKAKLSQKKRELAEKFEFDRRGLR